MTRPVVFDITFHPVAVADLQRYCFDFAADQADIHRRLEEIGRTPDKRRSLWDSLIRLPDRLERVRRGEKAFGQMVGFMAAVVAGYIHPYWYARGSDERFLCGRHPSLPSYFTPLPHVATGPVSALADAAGGVLSTNYSASGIVPPEGTARLDRFLGELALAGGFKSISDREDFDALERAVGYAAQHGLGLMEAAGLAEPFRDRYFSDYDNLRARFLGDVEDAKPGRPPATQSDHQRPIEEFFAAKRTLHQLTGMKVRTLGDLLAKSEADLRAALSLKSMRDVLETLAEMQLKLR